jgi:hypothetical protein
VKYEPVTAEMREQLERERIELLTQAEYWARQASEAHRGLRVAQTAIERIRQRLDEPDPFGRPQEI